MARTESTTAIPAQPLAGRALLTGQALLKFVRRKPLGAAGGAIVLIMLVLAVFAPLITFYDYKESIGMRFESLSRLHWFGTDQIGRDIYTRVIYGARVSLYVGVVSVGIGVTGGLLWGMVSAYFGGLLDLLTQRIGDVLMAFPALVLALAMMTVLGSSTNNVIIALIIVLAPGAARTLRGSVLTVKESQFVDAARAIGASHGRILARHILPNIMAPYTVLVTINLGYTIILEAGLSFLGVGVPPEEPSWGGMLTYAAQQYVGTAPWLALFPGVALSSVVFGFNLLGDAVRDVLDPRLRRS